ncbi:TPA: biopolymer transporter ExbD [bacterium]|nr:biopolymer transporter ExbD [bacterium]
MRARRPELTIAPLIDCVFLLLLFFAVSTSLIKEHGMPIDKPKAKSGIPLARDYFMITVTSDERIFLGKEEVSFDILKGRLVDCLLKNPEISVIIASDKKASCGRLIDVLDLCKEIGAKSLSVATIPKLE